MSAITTAATGPEGFALSAQQRRIWTDARDARVEAAIAIDGPLDRARLRAALGRVVARHPALRTAFHMVDGLRFPLQIVHDELAADWQEVTGDDDDDRPPPLDPLGPLDGTPIRARLIALPSGRHHLVLTVRALCADRPSLAIAVRDLIDAHGGSAPVAADDEVDHLQLAAWQDSLAEQDEAAAAAVFWRDQAARAGRGAPLAIELASAPPAPPSAEAHRRLDAGVRAHVAAVAGACGVSMTALLLASFQRVLAGFAADGAVSTRVTVDLRDEELTSDLCGAVEQDVPIAAEATAGSLRHHAAAVELALRAAGDNLPLYRPDRDPAQACSSLAIGFRHADDRALAPRTAAGATFRWLEATTRSVAPLTVECIDRSDGMALTCRHDASRFPPALIDAVLDALVLGLAGASPDASPGDLPLATAAPPGEGATAARTGVLHELFREAAARWPERVAVCCDRIELTFAGLAERAGRIAAALRRRGVARGEPVALLLERSSHQIAAILGVLQAGAAYAPLHTAYPGERLRSILDGAGVRVVLVDRPAGDLLGARDLIDVSGDLPAADGAPAAAVSPDDLAYVIHTSGSTGAPRGVEVTHGAVVNLLGALAARVHGTDGLPRRFSLNAPIAFDSSVKQWVQLLDGHAVCVVPEDRRLEPSALWSWAIEAGVDVLDLTPSQLRLLLACGAPAARPGPTAMLVGGEAFDPALWASAAAHPAITFHNVYGPTECTVDATAARVGAGGPTVGSALDGVQVHVLDAAMRPLPVGAPGEVYIGGAGVARGYRGLPAATAERFLPDPFAAAPGARLYRTGDLAVRRGDGALAYLGRRDGQVKVRGHRVELDEIAAVLRRAPGVGDAALALRASAAGGPTDERLVAYVVARAGADLTPALLRDHLRERLPEVMVPSAFVFLAALPLTANGKLARDALPEPAEALAAAPGGPAHGSRTVRVITAIWREVLGIDAIGPGDNFFDLGGHSLRMVQVHARLREAFGREIPIVDLFRHPTVAALSAYFDRPSAPPEAARPSSDRADRRRSAAVSRAQSKGRRRT